MVLGAVEIAVGDLSVIFGLQPLLEELAKHETEEIREMASALLTNIMSRDHAWFPKDSMCPASMSQVVDREYCEILVSFCSSNTIVF